MKDRPGGLQSSLWNTWDTFWQKTNIVGINNAGNSRGSAIRQFIWIVIFVGFLVATIIGVNSFVTEYFKYPVDIKVTVNHMDKVRFKLFCYAIVGLYFCLKIYSLYLFDISWIFRFNFLL